MMRRSLLNVLTLVVCMTLMAAFGWAASTVLYETGFEPANDPSGTNFTLGDLNGQGGWVAEGTATVTDAQAQSGTQSVMMAADSTISRNLSGNGMIWIVGQYRGDGSAATDPQYPTDTPAACIVHFSQANGVQCFDGNGSGGGAFTPATGGSPVSSSDWTEVALRIVYDDAEWDCLLNGVAYRTALGFRDNISSLSGFKSLSGTESYFDSFRVISSDGDVDGDGFGDGFEIDNGSNPLDPGSRPLLLLDVDGDGAVTALDGIKQYRIAKGVMTQTTEVLRDVNCDGLMDEVDGLLIYKWAMGDPTVPVLPACSN